MENIFKGVWYRSAVKLEGETIIPLPPFEEYNPFDFYYPASELRQGQKSLYLEYLAVDTDNPQAIINFCERYGVLGSVSRVADLQFSRLENEFKKKNPNSYEEIFKRYRGFFISNAGNPKLNTLSPEDLCRPVSIHFFDNRMYNMHLALERYVSDFSSEQKKQLGDRINCGIHESLIRPQVNWNIQREQYELFWPSLTLEGYFHLMAMWDLLGPGKIIPCPHCEKLFLAAADRTKFCSSTCYNNSKVQKYQKKKKTEKLAALKGKKSTTTKSTGKKK